MDHIGIPDDEGIDAMPTLPDYSVRIAEDFSAKNTQCEYSHDFGADWRHTVGIEDGRGAGTGPHFMLVRVPGCGVYIAPLWVGCQGGVAGTAEPDRRPRLALRRTRTPAH